jgi:hypothetical protein
VPTILLKEDGKKRGFRGMWFVNRKGTDLLAWGLYFICRLARRISGLRYGRDPISSCA